MDSSINSSSSSIGNKESCEAIQLVSTLDKAENGKNDALTEDKNSSQEISLGFTEYHFQHNNAAKDRDAENTGSHKIETTSNNKDANNPENFDNNWKSDDEATAATKLLKNTFRQENPLHDSIYEEKPCFFSAFESHLCNEQQSIENRGELHCNKNEKSKHYNNLKGSNNSEVKATSEGSPTYNSTDSIQSVMSTSNHPTSTMVRSIEESLEINPIDFQSNEMAEQKWTNECKPKKRISTTKNSEEHGRPAVRTRNSTNLAIRGFFQDAFTSEGNSLSEISFEAPEPFGNVIDDSFETRYSFFNCIQQLNQESCYSDLIEEMEVCRNYSYFNSNEERKQLRNKRRKIIEEKEKILLNIGKYKTGGKGEASKDCQTVSVSLVDMDLRNARIPRYPSEPLFDKSKHNSRFTVAKASKSCDHYQCAELRNDPSNEFSDGQEEPTDSDSETSFGPLICIANVSKETMLSSGTKRVEKANPRNERREKIANENVSDSHMWKSIACSSGKKNESSITPKQTDLTSLSKGVHDNQNDLIDIHAQKFSSRKCGVLNEIKQTTEDEQNQNTKILDKLDEGPSTEKQQGYFRTESILPLLINDVVPTSEKGSVYKSISAKDVDDSHSVNQHSTSSEDDLETIKLEIISNYYGNVNKTSNFSKDTSSDSLNSPSSSKETAIEDIIQDIECNYYSNRNQMLHGKSNFLENISRRTDKNKDFPGNKYRIESSGDSEEETRESQFRTFSMRYSERNNEDLRDNTSKSENTPNTFSECARHSDSSKVSLLKCNNTENEENEYSCAKANINIGYGASIRNNRNNISQIYRNDQYSDSDLFSALKQNHNETKRHNKERLADNAFDSTSEMSSSQLQDAEGNLRGSGNKCREKHSHEHHRSSLGKLKKCILSRVFRKHQKNGSSWCIPLSTKGSENINKNSLKVSRNSPFCEQMESSHNRSVISRERDCYLERTPLRSPLQDAIESYERDIRNIGKLTEVQDSNKGHVEKNQERHQKQKSHFWQKIKQEKHRKGEHNLHNEIDNIYPPEMTIVHPRPSRVPNYQWTYSRHLPYYYTNDIQNSEMEEEIPPYTEQD